MKKFLLNIQSGVIHSGISPCYQGKMMSEANKKWFDKFSDAVNFYEGKTKTGVPCCRCLKEYDV